MSASSAHFEALPEIEKKIGRLRCKRPKSREETPREGAR